MAGHDNPFCLLGDDDDGDDVSVLLAKVEAKISPPPAASEKPKQRTPPDSFPSKQPPLRENLRVDRGRGRGGRGRGTGRGGFGNPGEGEAAEYMENGYGRGYSGEVSGGRGRGRIRGRGRGRGANQFDNENHGQGGEEGAEGTEQEYYGGRRPFKYEGRNMGEENLGKTGGERENRIVGDYGTGNENSAFRRYNADNENRGFRKYGIDGVNKDGDDGMGHERSGGDGDYRGFRNEVRGRGYGGRGRRGGRDGGRFSDRNKFNEGEDAPEVKEGDADKDTTAKNTNDGDGGARGESPVIEESKGRQLEKPLPEQVTSEDAFKVPEEDSNMTLAEYEQVLQEKRKALESLKSEARKVVLDKDFEGMQLMAKKKEEELVIKKSDKDKGKRKEIAEKEDKSRKYVSINEFLKPAGGERLRPSSRGRGGRGRGREGFLGDGFRSQAAPSIEDPGQFPLLGAVAKA
ncbi:hypothetical protein HPP92_000414 [Vanilla planifolia]|uniref:Hyaluronan/mRNA-binding protein domain-containing protein n=1 Tax=Vanilla planifolia TaxID=51239 RepID=A0A835SB57_VANPL|nr:hypothetical protein HPP92_000414 [Vanilla planifolia]